MAWGDYVRVSVRDHSVGMDEDTLQRALDPFFTTKPGASGRASGWELEPIELERGLRETTRTTSGRRR